MRGGFVPSAAGSVTGSTSAAEPLVIDATSDGQVVPVGNYLINSQASAFAVLLEYEVGRRWSFTDLGAAGDNPVSIGSAQDTFLFEGNVAAGPFAIDQSLASVTLLATVNPNEYVVFRGA